MPLLQCIVFLLKVFSENQQKERKRVRLKKKKKMFLGNRGLLNFFSAWISADIIVCNFGYQRCSFGKQMTVEITLRACLHKMLNV